MPELFEYAQIPRRQHNVISVNSNYTVKSSDEFIGVNTINNPISIVLPILIGMVVTVKDITGNSGVNNITITSISGVIDGSNSFVISNGFNAVSLFCDGFNWWVF